MDKELLPESSRVDNQNDAQNTPPSKIDGEQLSELSWLVAECGFLSPRNRRATTTQVNTVSTPARSTTAPPVRTSKINHPVPCTSSISAKVTLQSLGLSLNDRVCIGSGNTSHAKLDVPARCFDVGCRIGKLRYCGPVGFASGIWVGVELDQPLGRHNGTVAGVQYFSCAAKHGVFSPIGRVYKAPAEGFGNQCNLVASKSSDRKTSLDEQSQSRGWASDTMYDETNRRIPMSRSSYSLTSSMEQERLSTPPLTSHRIDVSHVTAKVDTGLRSPDVDAIQKFQLGDRVLVSGQRRGTIRFIGTTHFASGTWYGVELEQAVGKNNGSIGGISYFECPADHGVFAPIGKLQRLPNRPRTPQSTLRYIGQISFADGIWLGVELRRPRGRHDGSVAGKRYFTCRPGHGLLVRPSRVFYRGINAVNLLPPAFATIEQDVIAKRQVKLQNCGNGESISTSSTTSDKRKS
ncbi:CAP-Gly domain-containing linker protein 3/4 [Paragonimus westermani]|uniref:CAP-Gly domain-containing linker protein 3/4 n=1 Tax=Paragonimus westermani TaxID=34504 RepID=A0A5J4NF31_9TREM|nr:CAP-Gly domain-containing linker protein 3/4 [Paragonimus westermani]